MKSYLLIAIVSFLCVVAGRRFFVGESITIAVSDIPERMEAGTDVTVDAIITNRGNKPIRLTNLKKSCSCMGVSSDGKTDAEIIPMSIAPGERKTLSILLTSIGRSGRFESALSTEWELEASDQKLLRQIDLVTQVYRPLEAVPPTKELLISVGEEANAGPLARASVTLKDSFGVPICDAKVVTSAETIRAELSTLLDSPWLPEPKQVPRGELEIQVLNPLSETMQAWVEVSYRYQSETKMRSVKIPLTLTVQNPCRIFPEQVTVPVGISIVKRSITVLCDRPPSRFEVKSTSDQLRSTVGEFERTSDGKVKVRIDVEISASIPLSAAFVVRVNGREVEVPVTVF